MNSANKSDIGNFYEFLKAVSERNPRELSFLNASWKDLKQWRSAAQKKVLELLSYFHPEGPLDATTVCASEHHDYWQEEVEFNTSAFTRARGAVLIPKKGKKPFPAVVAIHDHGGFYYYGREKIIQADGLPKLVDEFKRECYSGNSWATDLVGRGYVVLVIDAFFFGEKRVDYDALSEAAKDMLGAPLAGLEPESDAYIHAYNEMCKQFEGLLIKHIFMAGTTWAGILSHDDRACVDYLLSRDDVDASRIGCCGLSIGGFRSALLAGTDVRVACSVVAGWMPTFHSLLHSHLRNHTYMVYIPGLSRHMDFPDLVSMAVPNSLFVQQCRQDALYPEEGMREAGEHLKRVYEKAGAADKFKYKFYECPHQFNTEMQRDAFEWLDTHLMKSTR